MKTSKVYFTDIRVDKQINFSEIIDNLLSAVQFDQRFGDKEFVAIKLDFAEEKDSSSIRPDHLKKIVERIMALDAKPFFTDTNSLDEGARGDAVSHMLTAAHNGFDSSALGAPVIIADGLKSENNTEVYIGGDHCDEVKIAGTISSADGIIAVTHFKGDEQTGFSGAIKTLGMGCASREGKLAQYSNLAPFVERDGCVGCAACIRCCPTMATHMTGGHALIEKSKCIGCGKCIIACPERTIKIQWDGTPLIEQEKMAEYALGVIYNKRRKSVFVNFIIDVFPECSTKTAAPIIHNTGIAVSHDPVALDQASVDLVNGKRADKGSALKNDNEEGVDKFKECYPEIEWESQLKTADIIGVGSRKYELINVR